MATVPQRPSRVMWVPGDSDEPEEISISELLDRIPNGDLLILNDTKVLKRRVFAGDIEILFLSSRDQISWDVLFPAGRFQIGQKIELPLGIEMELIEKGRPQKVHTSRPLTNEYFDQIAEMPLPPYIQKARSDRHTFEEDSSWYQTAWAAKPGSLASPTASLHFTKSDLAKLEAKGVRICLLTLHVGLGTFLPVTTEHLAEHKMHAEFVEIPRETWDAILRAKKGHHKIWCLGTTSARAVESAARGLLQVGTTGWEGVTQIMIAPPFDWKIVDRLLTNFHQPESTLLALVAAFANLAKVKACYRWAIDRKFRLFSYGDLSVWLRN